MIAEGGGRQPGHAPCDNRYRDHRSVPGGTRRGDLPMKKTALCLLPIIAGLLLSVGSLPASAAGAAAATEPLTILKPNLKVVSSLSAPYTDPMTGHRVLTLAFSIQNTGWLPAPATKTTLTLEA